MRSDKIAEQLRVTESLDNNSKFSRVFVHFHLVYREIPKGEHMKIQRKDIDRNIMQHPKPDANSPYFNTFISYFSSFPV